MKILALLSGGIDSTVAIADTIHKGHTITKALLFNYGQINFTTELEAASHIANYYKIALEIIESKELLQTLVVLKKDTYISAKSFISAFYFYASLVVKGSNIEALLGGWRMYKLFYSHYETIENYIRLLMDIEEFSLLLPLQGFDKVHIIEKGLWLKAPLHLTWSCINPVKQVSFQEFSTIACGTCLACLPRLDAFHQLNLDDTIRYEVKND